MNRFDGQVAIITGAASGIGRQIALRFVREGGISVIADLDSRPLGRRAKRIA